MAVTDSIQFQKKQLNGDTLTPVVIYKRLAGEKKFLLGEFGTPYRKGSLFHHWSESLQGIDR